MKIRGSHLKTHRKTHAGLVLGLLALTSLGLISSTPSVQGATAGLVCVADPSTNNCPSNPIVLTGTNGTTITIAINIQSSASLNGFDIFVKGDTRVLQPISYDLTGTVLGTNILVVGNCVEYIGQGCTSQTGPGIVRIAAVAIGTATPAPTTGRLFTVTYKVLASATNMKVGFQTGCPGSSALPDFCATVVDGSTIQPETVLESTGVIGDFSLQSAPTALSIPRGGGALFQILFYSVDGFSGSISYTLSLTPVKKNGPTVILLDNNVINLLPGTFTDQLFGAFSYPLTPPGTYTFTLTATAGTLSHNIQTSIIVVAKR